MIDAISAWMRGTAWGAPHWVFIIIAAFVIVERVLGGSKNPQVRSTLAALATGMNWVLHFTRIAMIPVVGTTAVKLLELVSGADIDGDGKVGAEEPTKPGVSPPATP